MSKSVICVVLFCVVTIALFITFLKLLIDITPPPLKSEIDNETVVDLTIDDAMYIDLEDFPNDLKLKYGLAKTFDKKNPRQINYTYVLLSPLKESSRTNYIKHNIVLPPVWPSDSVMRESFENELLKIKRRSIKDVQNDTITNPLKDLVVKIIDDKDPRIEIKLAPHNSSKEIAKNYKSIRRELKRHKSIIEELKLKIDEDKITVFNMSNYLIQFLNRIVRLKDHDNFSKDSSGNITEVQPSETNIVLTNKEWKLIQNTEDRI